MATYGFEIEFGDLSFKSVNSIPDGVDIFEIRNNLGQVLYFIKADNSQNEPDGVYQFESIIEAASNYPIIGGGAPDINLFDSLTTFLNYLINLPDNNHDRTVQAGTVWDLGGGISAVCVYNGQPVFINFNVDNVDELDVFTQFTFGFGPDNDNLILSRFYNHFVTNQPIPPHEPTQPPSSRVIELIEDLFAQRPGWIDGDPSYLPYSTPARHLFLTYFDFLNDITWLRRWRAIEFFRFCLALSIRDMHPGNLWMGNKVYMKIMSRVAMTSILNFNLSDDELNNLVGYIQNSFTGPNRIKCPFDPMAPNDFIAAPLDPTQEVRPDIENAYQHALENTHGIEFFIRKIFRPNTKVIEMRQGFQDDNTLRNLWEMHAVAPNPDLQGMYDNIANYDYFSPVPFSERTDPLGYYTRYTAAPPRFLFEIRYAQQLLPADEIYDDDYRQVCIDEFTRAFNNWV